MKTTRAKWNNERAQIFAVVDIVERVLNEQESPSVGVLGGVSVIDPVVHHIAEVAHERFAILAADNVPEILEGLTAEQIQSDFRFQGFDEILQMSHRDSGWAIVILEQDNPVPCFSRA